MAALGGFPPFDSATERWEAYKQRFTSYLLAMDIIEDAKKSAHLIALIGPQTYETLTGLTASRIPNECAFDELYALLTNHLDPKPTRIMERFRFHRLVQDKGCTIAEYMARLRKQASKCDFQPAVLEEDICDQFVCGLHNAQIQRRLLAETDLTLQNAIKIATTLEITSGESQKIQNMHNSELLNANQSLNAITTQKASFRSGDSTSRNTFNRSGNCHRCGATGHWALQCTMKDYICRKCGKRGHLAKVCRSGGGRSAYSRQTRPINEIDTVSSNSFQSEGAQGVELINEDECEIFTVYNMECFTEECPPWMAPFQIHGHWVLLQLDCGAGVTVMGHSFWKKLNISSPMLKTNIKLRDYNKEPIPVLGKVRVNVRSIGAEPIQEKEIIIVQQEDRVPLVGRTWLNDIKIDWRKAVSCSNAKELMKCSQILQSEKYTTDPRIKRLTKAFSPLFKEDLGKIQGMQAHITLKDGAKPKFYNTRPIPFSIKSKVEETLQKEINEGILEPCKASEWASPIVPIIKPTGAVRVCADYKVTINQQIIVDSHPLPRIAELLYRLNGGKKFTKLDLARAYHQVSLDAESSMLTVINTPLGLLRYTRLPFGVASAPAIFQRCMDKILQGLSGVAWFMDDIVVTGINDQEHLNNLRQVFQRFQDAGVRLGLPKCEFFKDKVKFVGHMLSAEGIQPISSKVRAVQEMIAPKNVTGLHSFLGFAQYYSKYINHFATICSPLFSLLRKDVPWNWSKVCQDTFEKLKELPLEDHILCHYNPALPLILACDASQYGVGAVLSHRFPNGDEKPIVFASRTLNSAQQKYGHIEKEAYSILFGLKHFYIYLVGNKFLLQTDHKPLTALFSPSKALPVLTTSRLQRWATTIMGCDYTIEFRGTKEHTNADGLSRLPLCESSNEDDDSVEIHAITAQCLAKSPVQLSLLELQRATKSDPILSTIQKYMKNGWPKTIALECLPYSPKRYELTRVNGLPLWNQRIVIPQVHQIAVMQDLHMGHPGEIRMLRRAQQCVWWPGYTKDCIDIVSRCQDCQVSRPASPQDWSSWKKETSPWHRVDVDHAGPFLNRYWLVMVDNFSGWPEIISVPNLTSKATIQAFWSIFSHTGIPQVLVSDNGTAFTSTEMHKFCTNLGIKQVFAPPYHPQSNGQAERFVRTFKTVLKGKAALTDSERQVAISQFLLSYRTTPKSNGLTPAQAMFGRNLYQRLDFWRFHQPINKDQNTGHKYKVGTDVWFKWYGLHNGIKEKNWIWKPGKIVNHEGAKLVKIQTDEMSVRRHIDQIRLRKPSQDTAMNESISDIWGDNGTSGTPTVAPTIIPTVADTQVQVQSTSRQEPYVLRSRRAIRPPERLNYS